MTLRTPACLLALTLLATSASAGVVMRFQETKGDDTAPIVGTAWISGDRVKVESGSEVVIFRGDKQLLWAWSAGDKTYTELTKAEANEMSAAMAELEKQMASMPPEQRAMVQQAMAGQMGNLSSRVDGGGAASSAPLEVKALGTTQGIGDWKCADHAMSRGGKPEGEACVASWDQFGITAADFAGLEKLEAFISAVAGPFASRIDATYAQRYGDGGFPGVPLRVVRNTPAGKSVHEVQKLVKEDVPASTFELPAGMTRQALDAPSRRR